MPGGRAADACIFGLFFAFSSATFVTAAVRSGCLAASISSANRREHGMNINVNRRKAVLLTGLFATSLLAIATAPARAQETTLAIKGYDPVAYFTDGKPVQGAPAFEYAWDEHRWRFSSAEHL